MLDLEGNVSTVQATTDPRAAARWPGTKAALVYLAVDEPRVASVRAEVRRRSTMPIRTA